MRAEARINAEKKIIKDKTYLLICKCENHLYNEAKITYQQKLLEGVNIVCSSTDQRQKIC